MKKRTKGILAFAFLGGIMVTSGVTIAIPGIIPDDAGMNITMTGTPADNFPDEQRAQFCGLGTSKSNQYIDEFSIPTPCTQPLAITSDSAGNIWFMQTNTGGVARFDPVTETFSEYANPSWPPGARSMFWGMDYSPDNSIWYSDEAHDSIWRFSIDSQEYQRFNFPSEGNSLPQRLMLDGSQIIINDFTGNKLTVMDASAFSQGDHVNIPSPVDQSVTAGFAQDSASNLWYTNWIPNLDGVLVRLDLVGYQTAISDESDMVPNMAEHAVIFRLPAQAAATNGITVDGSDNVWLADTATSNFYRFDPNTEAFTAYVSSPVPAASFGNQTGLIKDEPLSRPYWMELNEQGQIIFNEQTANRIALFDPRTERLVEYNIPSMNPLWSDCGVMVECGIAQAFDFTITGTKIWFTQWATNNIGVVDTSTDLSVDVSVDASQVFYTEDSSVIMEITSRSDSDILPVSASAAGEMIRLSPDVESIRSVAGSTDHVSYDISVSPDLPPGIYKVLVGAQASDITVSEFFTLIVG